MARKIKRKQVKQLKKTKGSPFNIYWEKQNYYLLVLGLAVIVIGFYVMSIGPWDSFYSIALSPILLFIGYVIIFPLSIFLRKKSDKEKLSEKENAASES